MNQILVTKKLYITPELKRKKKIYKIEFFLSVFLVFTLISAYIYAEYDRNKSEEVSQEILANFEIPEIQEEDTTVAKNNILVVVLDDEEQNELQEEPQVNSQEIQVSQSGYQFTTIATINIPKINVVYPIIDGVTDSAEETEELLKISPTKFWGSEPNQIGNFCVVGHNYRNTKFFSKLHNIKIGDIVELTDVNGKTLNYTVYETDIIDPDNNDCTSQLTNGHTEITLITCHNKALQRFIVKARAN